MIYGLQGPLETRVKKKNYEDEKKGLTVFTQVRISILHRRTTITKVKNEAGKFFEN
jgi:hypothetical protein